MAEDLVNRIILTCPKQDNEIKKSLGKLSTLAQRANFEHCIPMINVESSWIEPVSGYVAKLNTHAPFVAEPFLIDMFRGHSVLLVNLEGNTVTLDTMKSIPFILNGTIMEDSPKPFNIHNPDDAWVPSLGRRNSYVGLYTAHIGQYQACIICNSGLDEKVIYKLQEFFVNQELAKKTNQEVFTSTFIARIRKYSSENRKRIIHTFAQIIGITTPELSTYIDHIPDTLTKRVTPESSRELFTAVEYYCANTQNCVVSTNFVFPTSDDVDAKFRGYPLGPTLIHLYKRQRKAFDVLNKRMEELHNKLVVLIGTYTVNKDHMINLPIHIDTEYNYVTSTNNTLVFFSGCSSTHDSGGKIVVSRHPEHGPTIFFNGNTLNKSQRWGNDYGDAFHAYTNHIGVYVSTGNLPNSQREGAITLHDIKTSDYFRNKRTETPPEITKRLGFNTLHGTTVRCRRLLVKFTL